MGLKEGTQLFRTLSVQKWVEENPDQWQTLIDSPNYVSKSQSGHTRHILTYSE